MRETPAFFGPMAALPDPMSLPLGAYFYATDEPHAWKVAHSGAYSKLWISVPYELTGTLREMIKIDLNTVCKGLSYFASDIGKQFFLGLVGGTKYWFIDDDKIRLAPTEPIIGTMKVNADVYAIGTVLISSKTGARYVVKLDHYGKHGLWHMKPEETKIRYNVITLSTHDTHWRYFRQQLTAEDAECERICAFEDPDVIAAEVDTEDDPMPPWLGRDRSIDVDI